MHIPADRWAGFGPATIIRADARNLPLADSTVDLIVTSPPYFALRSYQDGGEHYDGQIGSEATPDEFLSALIAVTREMVRVLKPTGSIWVNLGDKYAGKSLIGLPWQYALRAVRELGLILRAEVIWAKPNGLPESVTDRVRRSHETWFHFVTQPRYFAAVNEIREPYAPDASDRRTRYRTPSDSRYAPCDRNDADRKTVMGVGIVEHPLGRLPGSVRTVATSPLRVPEWLGVDHFAAFPPAWPAWIIRGWSPSGICVECGEGLRPVVDKTLRPIHEQANHRKRIDGTEPNGNSRGINADHRVVGASEVTITGYACACPTPDAPTRPAVVLDPFGGTGTTAMAARALGRHGISVDLSMDYCRLAEWRVQDLDELAAVRGLPREGRKATDEPTLLDLIEEEA